MEKLFQFPDSVPCKIRAKRGCATHPRSIAERVRRTRISERMRKLQELVPNMDKVLDTSILFDFETYWIICLTFVHVLGSKLTHQTCWTWLLITLKNFKNNSRYIYKGDLIWIWFYPL